MDERVMKESKTGSVVQTEIGEKGRRREVRKVEWKGWRHVVGFGRPLDTRVREGVNS